MDFGAAHVGLGDLGDQAAGRRSRNFVFVKFDFVLAGDKGDFSFHLDGSSMVPRWLGLMGSSCGRLRDDCAALPHYCWISPARPTMSRAKGWSPDASSPA